MGVKARFSPQQLRDDIARRANLVDRVIENRLAEVGEVAVNDARSVDTYRDQTGNLRSSTGYVLASDRGIVAENFETVIPGGGEGKRKGTEVARDRVAGLKGGWKLSIVAGMDYASNVESRGYDVLTSAGLKVEQKMPGVLRRIKVDVKNVR